MRAPDITPDLPTSVPLDECRVCLIGEAPGADEVAQGRPFVGRAGKLLDTALEQAGINRGACYVSNVFWCRPPGNQVDWFFLDGRAEGERSARFAPFRGKYLRREWEPEMDRLAAELVALKPDLVLALGSTPLWALSGLDKIGTFRGRQVPARNGIRAGTIVPTWHPAYVLRSPSALPQLVTDLRAGLELAGIAAAGQ